MLRQLDLLLPAWVFPAKKGERLKGGGQLGRSGFVLFFDEGSEGHFFRGVSRLVDRLEVYFLK